MPGEFQVLLHEGVVAEAVRPRLAEGIRRIYARVFGVAEDQVTVAITEIPQGRFFTAARPSRSSLIGGSVAAGTSQADRARLMSEITSMWCDVTGCTPNEVVVSVSDDPA
jgi:phenylpyruvate tautomerase PptA (4-oxalocrotonate tautomerase family)